MPRVPLYEPNRVGPVETTGARFNAARDPGSIGQSVGRLGDAIQRYALTQDKIDEQFDDTVSRRLMLEYQKGSAAIKSEYEALEGMAAVEARKDADERLKKLYTETMGKASNARMREMTSMRLDGLFAEDGIKVGSHAIKQMNLEADKTQLAQIEMAAETAVANWSDPELLKAHLNTGIEVLDTFAARKGWTEERLKNEADKFRSDVHKKVVGNFLVDDDVDGAEAYLEANADELLWSDELSLRADLKAPLENRQAYKDYQAAAGMIEPETGAPIVDDAPWVAPFEGFANASITGKIGDPRDGGKRSHNGEDFPMPIGTPLVAPGKGKVVSTKSTPAGGKQIIIEFANGDRMGIAHISEHKVAEGDEVEAGQVIALSGNTGTSTGPHSHMTVTVGGEKVSPSEYFKKAKAPASSPRRWDKAQVFEKIDDLAEKEGWSFERTERAKNRADKEIARDEQLLARQEDQATREANEIVIGLGERFTDVSMIPKDVRDRMAPEALASFTDAAARNAAPKPVAANGDAQLALNLIRIQEPDKFKEIPLGQYRGLMAPAEFDDLVKQQATLRAEKPAAFSPRNQITSTISWGEDYGGLGKLDQESKIAIYDIMDNLVREEYRKTGKPPTEEVYQAALRLATKEIKTVSRGVLWNSEGSMPLYEMTADNIPAKTRTAMESAFKAQYGRLPTEDELTKMYRIRRAGQ